MVQKVDVVGHVFGVTVEIHNEPITLINLDVLVIEKATATLVVKDARDLTFYLSLLILIIN